MSAEGNTGYSIKDFLAIHTKALERIEQKVDEGALRQAEVVGGINTRLSIIEAQNLDPRVRILEDARSNEQGEKGFKRYLWPIALGLLGAAWWIPDFVHKLGHS